MLQVELGHVIAGILVAKAGGVGEQVANGDRAFCRAGLCRVAVNYDLHVGKGRQELGEGLVQAQFSLLD